MTTIVSGDVKTTTSKSAPPSKLDDIISPRAQQEMSAITKEFMGLVRNAGVGNGVPVAVAKTVINDRVKELAAIIFSDLDGADKEGYDGHITKEVAQAKLAKLEELLKPIQQNAIFGKIISDTLDKAHDTIEHMSNGKHNSEKMLEKFDKKIEKSTNEFITAFDDDKNGLLDLKDFIAFQQKSRNASGAPAEKTFSDPNQKEAHPTNGVLMELRPLESAKRDTISKATGVPR